MHTGAELGLDQDLDELAPHNIEGDLNVDLAELSLGQRLTALSGNILPQDQSTSESESDEAGDEDRKPSKRTTSAAATALVPANSLTRTLIQALHSADSNLLETCLGHSDQALIRNTVRRLPPQLAIPLLMACMDRLGRGARAGTMKGRGGGASSQRGTSLMGWVKAVLALHSGHLMTVIPNPLASLTMSNNSFHQVPDLVARLSGLHATLTTRHALQESLLSLSGRLDMVMSQIEMRSSAAPAPIAMLSQKGAKASMKREVRRYVEGESEDEEDEMDVEVEVDSGDEGGSVEDVELGGDSDEDEEEEETEPSEGEDSDSEDEDSDDSGSRLNGFIDDEADEFDEDEDDDDDSE